MSNSGPGSELDSLCIRVGRLRITVEQVAEGSVQAAGSEASFRLWIQSLPLPLAGESSPPLEATAPPLKSPGDFLAASTPAEFGQLLPGPWTGKARVARAYRAGLSAADVLRGDRGAPVTSPKLLARLGL